MYADQMIIALRESWLSVNGMRLGGNFLLTADARVSLGFGRYKTENDEDELDGYARLRSMWRLYLLMRPSKRLTNYLGRVGFFGMMDTKDVQYVTAYAPIIWGPVAHVAFEF